MLTGMIGQPNPFSVSSSTVTVIAPGARFVVDALFTPTLNEPVSGRLTIVSNDPETPQLSLNLTGAGSAGGLVVQPGEVDLSETTVGRTRTVELVVRNLALEPLSNARLVAEGFARPSHFRLTGLPQFDQPAPFALDARLRQVLLLTYEPRALGDDSGVIRIETCGPRCGPEVRVVASADEAIVTLDPPEVDFSGVGIGEARSEVVDIINVGNSAATVRSVAAAGSSAFSVEVPSRPIPTTLQPGERVSVSVSFRPTEATPSRGAMVVQTNLGDVPELQAALTGQGEGPLFLVEPSEIQYGVERGVGRYQRSVLLLNAGSSQVQVSSISLAGAPEFSLGPLAGLPVRLGSGASLIVPVVFEPTEPGMYTGSLTIASDDPATPMTTVPIEAAMNDAVCNLQLSPNRILFGVMPTGHRRSRSVTVTNVGEDACEISSGMFRSPADPSISLAPSSTRLPVTLMPTSTTTPGVQALEFEFTYAPDEPRGAKATFVLNTEDAFFPERTISMAGQSDDYRLVFVRPPSIDFGAMTPRDCPEFIDEVTLFNVGLAPVRLVSSSLTSSSAGMLSSSEFRQITNPPAFTSIPPGDVFQFELGYQAQQLGADAAELEIQLENFAQPLVVPLQGEGSLNPRREETFQQVDNKEVDVLFVIDDSCSMDENQARVAANFSQFILAADARQVDFQLGITTTDTTRTPGALVGPVITRQTPNFQQVFRQQAAVGIGGSGIETGLEAMRAALEE
ncbi:MAG: choice-of-anchor D domain-containing protein, partial [Myxococcota bacterium]